MMSMRQIANANPQGRRLCVLSGLRVTALASYLFLRELAGEKGAELVENLLAAEGLHLNLH
jgi:hypothetical protein